MHDETLSCRNDACFEAKNAFCIMWHHEFWLHDLYAQPCISFSRSRNSLGTVLEMGHKTM